MKKKLEVIKIGKYEFKVLFADLPHDVTKEEYANLKSDIKENGVRVAIIVDEHMNIIDGVLRAKCCSELGFTKIPVTILPNLTDKDKRDVAVTLNSLRRLWSKEEKKKLAVVLRKKKFSYRRIAICLGIGLQTAHRWLQASGKVDEFPDEVIGEDGISRPARINKPMILARSAKDACESSKKLQASEYTNHLNPKVMFAGHLDRELNKARKKNPPEIESPKTIIGKSKLFLGDFREECKAIKDESVDICFTDPPYSENALILYEGLTEVASRILKPSGLLLSYCGNMYIPQIHRILGEKLEYIWTFAIRHTRGNTLIENTRVFQAYKPIVCYQKAPTNCYWTPFVDMTSGGKSKNYHEWEQPEMEAEYFLSHLAPKKRRVTMLDCMMGSGSFVVAAHRLGMDTYGIDIDTSAYATAKARVEQEEQKKTAE